MRSLLRQTSLWRLARGVKRTVRAARHDGPLAADQCRGRVAAVDPPVAVDPGRVSPWQLRVLNQSGQPWASTGAMPVRLSFQWRTHAGAAFGEPVTAPLPAAAYPGEPLECWAEITAPGFVGDFVLEIGLTQAGSGRPVGDPCRVAVPVTGGRDTDIDYHDVYRTADLGANHWWVVGAYHTREQYEKSQADRRDMLVKHAGLTPDSRVLDVGCGTGQMAAALEQYLSPRGGFLGTDIGREAVEYCQQNFRRPNFLFRQGGVTTVPFDAADGPVDLAIFFSVFTHTFTDETALLLAETARLLAPGGVVVADVITSPLVERGAGHRGQMVVNREHFVRLAGAVGFDADVIGKWKWNEHADRFMFRLSRRG